MKETKLKPCPRCGKSVKLLTRDLPRAFFIGHLGCQVHVSSSGDEAQEEEITRRWNELVDIENERKSMKTKENYTMGKHPSYNCQRGMLCPTCDKALWPQVEVKTFFGIKKITVKEQPNFCKYCGQALLPAYSGI
ncbi:MAG: hypothetical protein J6S14_12870 [Clostridia bacterium]|nr:hypothetical protein [Clostridia bacterium]